jgi:tRNA A37 threonylcarbamoyladenosine modification protein TsaB
VGVAAAATLGEALGVPVLGVCSLDALARQALGELAAPATASAGENGTELAQQLSLASVAEEGFIVASDARRKELYWAVYSAGGERLRGPYATVPGELPRLPVCGPAARLYPLPGAVSAAAARLDAGVLAAVADSLPGVGLEPLYLRRPDAEVTQKRKSVLPKPRISAAGLRRRP